MYKKIINILTNIVVISTILGCQSQKIGATPSNIDWDTLQITPQAENSLCWDLSLIEKPPAWEEIKQSFQSGLLIGISQEDISGAKEIGYQTYTIEPNQSTEVKLRLWYPGQNTDPAAIRFFALLNEKQLQNVFPSNQYYKDVIIPAGTETTVTLYLPPLAAGIYDFIIIGIPYIENYPTPEGIVKVLNHRISLIAGAPPSTPFRQISFSDLPPDGLISKGDPKISLSLTLADDSIETWNWPEQWLTTKPGVPLKFSMLTGHEDVTNLDAPHINKLDSSFFSLLLFFDYQQIEIAPNQTTIYGKVNKNIAYARTSVEIILTSSGKHQILALRINSPGVPMCILRPPPGGRILPFDVTGILVGVNVVSPED